MAAVALAAQAHQQAAQLTVGLVVLAIASCTGWRRNMPNTSNQLHFGLALNRFPGTLPADDIGTVQFWQAPLDQMYAQMPFPALHDNLSIDVYHMDSEEQDALEERRVCSLKDIYPDQPGRQGAAGLYVNRDIDVAVYPNNYTGDYEGPSRPITELNRIAARRVLSHEFGHYYFDQSRYNYNDDDISRRLTEAFRALRPRQAENEFEDSAEVYRAICGDDDTRGKFSDNKPFTPSPELKALVRCLYWMAGNLRGCWVASVTPIAGGVKYQVWIGLGWKWRFVSDYDWKQQEWNGSAWVAI